VARIKLIWQSKLVLLLVLPFAGAGVVLQAHWWAVNSWPVTAWTAGLSLLLGWPSSNCAQPRMAEPLWGR